MEASLSVESLSLTATQPLQQPVVQDRAMDLFQEVTLPNYWGRLYPAQPNVRFHELIKDVITVGKLKSCDVCLKINEVPNNVWVVVSRHHFSILRTPVTDKFGATTYKVQLKDCSMNGTYVDGQLIGKGSVVTIKDNTIISVGRPQNEVYYYKDALVTERLPEELQERYDMCVRLGTGAFGAVSLVFCKKTGKGYAMKSILKGNKTNQKKLDSELQKLENELRILRRIKHPNVIQLVDDIDCHTQKYLVLEIMRGRDLFHRITSSKRLTEPQSKLYFYQIVSGVRYLHENGIIHRDLKPENVLLATDDEDTVVKITDFGLSKVLESATFLTTFCGTKLYVAPEVLESGGVTRYTAQVDVWSMGVLLFVCLSGQTPFTTERNGMSMEEQIKQGLYAFQPNKWECVSSAAINLVKRMMTCNPQDRICVRDIFEDPWLQDPAMVEKVQMLLSTAEVEPVEPVERTPSPSLDAESSSEKENIPSDVDRLFSSPHPASIKLMSPPRSPAAPPRKRTRFM